MRTQELLRRAFFDYRARGTWAYNIVSAALVGIVTVSMFTSELDDKQRDAGDQMFPTGTLATIAALFLSTMTDRSPITLLRKMHNAALVSLPQSQESQIMRFQTLCSFWSHVVYGAILFVAGLGFAKVIIDMNPKVVAAETVPFIAAYVLTGLRFAKMTANGLLLHHVHDLCSRVNLRVGHRDGAGGLAIVGKFCLTQVSSLVIPITWLVYWVVAIILDPDSTGSRYGDWGPFFLVLLALVLSAAGIGCFLPMKTFRNIVVNWKECREKKQRTSILGKEQRQSYYYELAVMPNWPASPEDVRMALMGVVFPILLAATSALLTIILYAQEAVGGCVTN